MAGERRTWAAAGAKSPRGPSQIWLQGGTERVGQVMLDAYEATKDGYYLDSARKAADALVFGQHPLGGWHYFIDFDPAGTPDWYESRRVAISLGLRGISPLLRQRHFRRPRDAGRCDVLFGSIA